MLGASRQAKELRPIACHPRRSSGKRAAILKRPLGRGDELKPGQAVVHEEVLELRESDEIRHGLLEVKEFSETLFVGHELAQAGPDVAVVFERVRPTADGVEVDTEVQVEGRTVLRALQVDDDDGVAGVLAPRRCRLPETARLQGRGRARCGRLLFSDATVCT